MVRDLSNAYLYCLSHTCSVILMDLVGMVRINFQPYSQERLEKIVEARLASAQEGMDEDKKPSQVVIAPDAIKLAAMTVSRITGEPEGYWIFASSFFYINCSLFISLIFPVPY